MFDIVATSAARASETCSCVVREGSVGFRSMVTRGCWDVAADAVAGAAAVVGADVTLRDVEAEVDAWAREELEGNGGVRNGGFAVLDDEAVA